MRLGKEIFQIRREIDRRLHRPQPSSSTMWMISDLPSKSNILEFFDPAAVGREVSRMLRA